MIKIPINTSHLGGFCFLTPTIMAMVNTGPSRFIYEIALTGVSNATSSGNLVLNNKLGALYMLVPPCWYMLLMFTPCWSCATNHMCQMGSVL